MCKLIVLLCFAFFSWTDGAALMQDSVRLPAPIESADDILQALAGDVAPAFGSSGAFAAEPDYVEDRRRMLDAEKVAIKRIVRDSLAVLRPGTGAAI